MISLALFLEPQSSRRTWMMSAPPLDSTLQQWVSEATEKTYELGKNLADLRVVRPDQSFGGASCGGTSPAIHGGTVRASRH
jgi:hypothetical protein